MQQDTRYGQATGCAQATSYNEAVLKLSTKQSLSLISRAGMSNPSPDLGIVSRSDKDRYH